MTWQGAEFTFNKRVEVSLRDFVDPPLVQRAVGLTEEGLPAAATLSGAVYWSAYVLIPEHRLVNIWEKDTVPKQYRLGKARYFLDIFHAKSVWLTHANSVLERGEYYYDTPVLSVSISQATAPQQTYNKRFYGSYRFGSTVKADRLIIDLDFNAVDATLQIFYDYFVDEYLWYF